MTATLIEANLGNEYLLYSRNISILDDFTIYNSKKADADVKTRPGYNR